MNILARFIFENLPFDPVWASLLSGFAIIGLDGRMYLTEAGAEYLELYA